MKLGIFCFFFNSFLKKHSTCRSFNFLGKKCVKEPNFEPFVVSQFSTTLSITSWWHFFFFFQTNNQCQYQPASVVDSIMFCHYANEVPNHGTNLKYLQNIPQDLSPVYSEADCCAAVYIAHQNSKKKNYEMKAVLSKLRLPAFFCFFLLFFFLWAFKKNLFCQKKEIVYRNMPFHFFFFFATFFRKDIVDWNNAMSQKSNLFPNQNAPSHKKIQNMETKKNKTIKRKKKLVRGDISNS